MKKILILMLITALLITGCSNKNTEEPVQSSDVEVQSSDLEESSTESEEPEEEVITETEVDGALATEIVKTFGAEENLEGDGYITSVLSFYYNREGVASTHEITSYGYYGWFMEYKNRVEEETGESLEDKFPGLVLSEVYIDENGNEMYGIPAEGFEEIVTSFFDVDVEKLRSDDTLYREKENAYWPDAGPGIGERPSVSIGKTSDDGEIMSIEIIMNEGGSQDVEDDNQEYRMILKVRHKDDNKYGGIEFVSILPKA